MSPGIPDPSARARELIAKMRIIAFSADPFVQVTVLPDDDIGGESGRMPVFTKDALQKVMVPAIYSAGDADGQVLSPEYHGWQCVDARYRLWTNARPLSPNIQISRNDDYGPADRVLLQARLKFSAKRARVFTYVDAGDYWMPLGATVVVWDTNDRRMVEAISTIAGGITGGWWAIAQNVGSFALVGMNIVSPDDVQKAALAAKVARGFA